MYRGKNIIYLIEYSLYLFSNEGTISFSSKKFIEISSLQVINQVLILSFLIFDISFLSSLKIVPLVDITINNFP